MLIVISPAKTLDYDSPLPTDRYTQPEHLDDAALLVKRARQYNVDELMALMSISEKIATLNVERFKKWRRPFRPKNARQAILAFKGDVYAGLEAATFDDSDLEFAQDRLRILSGLYGLLRPLDLMQPYRLEMGRKVDTARGSSLYEFWGNRITESLNLQLQQSGSQHLINLASNEYFKAVKPELIAGTIITPQFKERRNGEYRTLGIYAKRARGILSRFIIKNRLTDPESIREFNEAGYRYNNKLSRGYNWVFCRNS